MALQSASDIFVNVQHNRFYNAMSNCRTNNG